MEFTAKDLHLQFKIAPKEAQRLFRILKKAQEVGEIREISEALEEANEVISGFGVESIVPPGSHWTADSVEYVNMGDTYDTTILYSWPEGKFFIGDWGSFHEEMEAEAYVEFQTEAYHELGTDIPDGIDEKKLTRDFFKDIYSWLWDAGLVQQETDGSYYPAWGNSDIKAAYAEIFPEAIVDEYEFDEW